MTSSSAAGEHRRGGGFGRIRGTDLAAVLHCAVSEALLRLNAVTVAVYLLDEDHAELQLAMIGGSPPSLFTLPGWLGLDAPCASARALASGQTAVLVDPDPPEADQQHVLPYPYVALSAPVTDADRRFGALTVLRLETFGTFRATEHAALQQIGNELAAALAQLAENGAAIAAGPTPMLVPVGSAPDTSICTPGWGVSGVPGSAGTSLMYPLRRLDDLLNQSTTMEAIVGAARYCLMSPFRAQALVLASASEGRLWVLGHSGASSGMVRSLHGSGLDPRTPAAEAIRGRPLFISDSRSTAADFGWSDGASQAEAYLPLTEGAPITELPFVGSRRVVGVCCLLFKEPRRFPPEERAVLSMVAGKLGAAVERVELNTKQHAVAEYLQRRLLPPTLRELPRMTTTARYRPATVTSKVGGDWYDVIKVPGERMVLVVGDVEGHALESAAVMGQVRTAVAAYAAEGHRPAAVIDRTGRLLAQLGTDLLVTCCVVAVDPVDGTTEVALAGHPAPLVLGPDGNVSTLEAPSNVPLGIDVPEACQGREHTLGHGSVLMLYSNGLGDCRASDPDADARALLSAGGHEAGTDLERLADHLMTDSSPQHRRDDAVLLLARCDGAVGEDGPRQGNLHIRHRDLQGVKTARDFVHDRLSSWELTDMSDALQLIASEIVTNALIHAGSDVDVRLRAFADHVRLEVRDSDSNPPVPSPLTLREEENVEAEHGRGLLIVEALAGVWNSSPNGRGKTVSVEVPVAKAEP
ncbi:ATP-binding SpoIIE family protein phosphatase [Streptomyces sp. 900105755]